MLEVVVNSIRLSDDNIYAQLKRIVQAAEEGQAEGKVNQVGILTAAKRDVWAAARKLLAEGIKRVNWNCFLICNIKIYRVGQIK